MAAVRVVPVTNRWLERQFLDLPSSLYASYPNWVPRLRSSEKELCGFKKHAFNDTAQSVAFVACRGEQVCGRILAIDNSIHNKTHPNESVGFVGFYESVDDDDVAQALFSASEDWLHQRGLKSVRGSVSPSMNYEAGLLIDGFEHMPSFMMPYNPEHYAGLWSRAGFEKVQDLFAFRGNQEIYDAAVRPMAIAAQAADRFGATFRQIDRRNFVAEVQEFLKLFNAGSAGTWGFVPFSDSEINQLAGELRFLIIPELTSFMCVGGKIAGAVFGLQDYNPIVKRIRGRLFPLGFLSLLWGRRKIKRSRMMSINILPQYQRWGLGICLLDQFLKQGSRLGIRDVEFSYVLESNHLAASTLANGGNIREKTYRIFEKRIEASGPVE